MQETGDVCVSGLAARADEAEGYPIARRVDAENGRRDESAGPAESPRPRRPRYGWRNFRRENGRGEVFGSEFIFCRTCYRV